MKNPQNPKTLSNSLASCEIPGKIREICAEKWRNGVNICKNLRTTSAKFDDILSYLENWCEGLQNSTDSAVYLCRLSKMLKNASFLTIVAVHTAENEPSEVGMSRWRFEDAGSEDP